MTIELHQVPQVLLPPRFPQFVPRQETCHITAIEPATEAVSSGNPGFMSVTFYPGSLTFSGRNIEKFHAFWFHVRIHVRLFFACKLSLARGPIPMHMWVVYIVYVLIMNMVMILWEKRHQPISYSNRREFHLKMSLLRRFRSFWGFNSQRWRQLPKVRSKKNHNKNPPCLCALCCFNVFKHACVWAFRSFFRKDFSITNLQTAMSPQQNLAYTPCKKKTVTGMDYSHLASFQGSFKYLF